MKKIIILCGVITMIAYGVKAQKINNAFPVKGKLVKILSWGTASNYMVPKFWLSNERNITEQIGPEELKDFKKICSSGKDPLPPGFQGWGDEDSIKVHGNPFDMSNV